MVFQKWDDLVPDYEAPPNKKFSSILVPTTDTIKYSYLLSQIIYKNKPGLFCGESGTAKSVTVGSAFRSLSHEKYMFLNINFSSRTSSLDFQNIFEDNIEKKTFKNYGPKISGKTLIVFIDDMNMPKIDTYGTQ